MPRRKPSVVRSDYVKRYPAELVACLEIMRDRFAKV